ncbi:hypothetical protein ZWY2020_059453 [Hordeum vulgare]|nr:hypothetical protein ZWY2020_059453 [Hordeum vulgare]
MCDGRVLQVAQRRRSGAAGVPHRARAGGCATGRNVSTGLYQCEMGEWKALPRWHVECCEVSYNSRYVDVKLAHKKSTVFSLSIQEELHK